MGGGSSTRNITLEEDEATGMVKVSEDVVKRMLGKEDEPIRGPKEERTPAPDIQKLQLEWQKKFDERERQWQDQLQKAEKKENIYEVTAEEFQKAAEEVETKFRQQRIVPICPKLQDAVLKCFQENPKQTLNCSKEVREFTKCVDQARTSILLKKTLDDAAS